MKTSFKTIASFIALCAWAVGAQAFVVFQDNFSYPNGPILTSAAPTWIPGYGNANSGQIQISGNQVVIPGTGTSDQPRLYFTNGLAYASLANYTNGGTIYISNATAAFFPSNSPIAAIYASFSATIPGSTGLGSSTYFAFFCDTNYDYRCRLFIVTNGAAPGNYRIGVANVSSSTTNIVQTDLVPGNTYTVAMRYILNSGISTVWVNPGTENTGDPTVSATGTGIVNIGGGSPGSSTCGFGLRNAAGLPNLTLGNLIIGTTFGDVIPASAGSNPPFIVQQPLDDLSAIVGDTVTFSTLAGGDQPLGYQWYYVSNNVTAGIIGATGSNLVLNAVATNTTGFYYAVVTNAAAGSATTSHAKLIVYSLPVAVTISNQPQSLIVNVGDTAVFNLVAAGVPPPTYQWFFVTNSGATLKTNPIAGATFATLTLTNLSTNTIYTNIFVNAVNRVDSTNSTPALLTVNPIQRLTIAQLRSMVDNTYTPTNTTSVYTIQGTVTTWTNMTGTANTEFYMQDNTAGVCVFWSGAGSTNRPPAGSVVKVTAPASSFDGLLEIEPVFSNPLHSVKVLSTNGPLPAPQPLPFDPNVTTAQLKAMESSYFVASNVTLTAGATFASGVNEPITANAGNALSDTMYGLTFTNQQGQPSTLYINSFTDIPGKAKPNGPVTIYGVLGYFNGVGFEFTPSRYADIVSYIHVTNVLSHLSRPGDAPTNTYTENFLLPGGTLTATVSIADPAGGDIMLSPLTGGLPASASWSNITGGQTGAATFSFSPVAADSGSNYVVNLAVTSTAGTAFTNVLTVYVPTTNEQEISISEFLANPATNVSAPNFNPLQRPGDTTGILTNDQYLEIANQSPADLVPGWTLDNGNPLSLLFDSNTGLGTTIQSSNSLVIYGGIGSGSPVLPAPAVLAPNNLTLPTAGNGLLVLRDSSGYIIDRVVYAPSDLNTNGSLTRFPTVNGAFVPQAYVGLKPVTPGLQYDGSAWNQLPQIPSGVTNVLAARSVTNLVLDFTAAASQVSTLWNAPVVGGPYKAVAGQVFLGAAGAFTNLYSGPQQFYYVTTQTNN
jgi:hypothetical protein